MVQRPQLRTDNALSTPPSTPAAVPPSADDRRGEWFVPTVGPLSLRLFIGMLFLPYTGMVLSFTVIGSLLADRIYWDRIGAIMLIYFLGLGVAAHALDALGSKGLKPWGAILSRRLLAWLAFLSIAAAYTVGGYYIVTVAPWLGVIAVAEGFFLFAYNLEWFSGRFHTDGWFAVSWGGLPVLAGYVLQTNRISMSAVFMAVAMGLISLAEINASRPYKMLKRQGRLSETENEQMHRLERILQSLSIAVIFSAVAFALVRWQELGR